MLKQSVVSEIPGVIHNCEDVVTSSSLILFHPNVNIHG